MLHYANARMTSFDFPCFVLETELFFQQVFCATELCRRAMVKSRWSKWSYLFCLDHLDTFYFSFSIYYSKGPRFDWTYSFFFLVMNAYTLFKSIHFTACLNSWISRSLQPMLITFYLPSLSLPRSVWVFGWLTYKRKIRTSHSTSLKAKFMWI